MNRKRNIVLPQVNDETSPVPSSESSLLSLASAVIASQKVMDKIKQDKQPTVDTGVIFILKPQEHNRVFRNEYTIAYYPQSRHRQNQSAHFQFQVQSSQKNELLYLKILSMTLAFKTFSKYLFPVSSRINYFLFNVFFFF